MFLIKKVSLVVGCFMEIIAQQAAGTNTIDRNYI